MGIKKHFNSKYMAVMLTFLAFSGIASGFFFWASSDKYAAIASSETAVETTVISVTYGFSEEGAREERGKIQPGEFCYVTVEAQGKPLRYPGLSCAVEAGQEVTIFVSDSGEARLDPVHMELAKNALTAYTFLGFIMGIGAALGAIFVWGKLRKDKLNPEEL